MTGIQTQSTEEVIERHIQALVLRDLDRVVGDYTDDGEYAYVLWSAGTVVPFAGDLFQVRAGKIVAQAIVQQTSSV